MVDSIIFSPLIAMNHGLIMVTAMILISGESLGSFTYSLVIGGVNQ